MMKKQTRYIYDALYGAIKLDFDPVVWKAISSPELQRLREVRLCNINSLCLTGGANVNRFEHSIGTCYLAQECLKAWPLFNPLSKYEERLFLLAALLHDAANAAFGHSLEYIESSNGFNPERDFSYALQGHKSESYQYKLATFETIFFDMGRELIEFITPQEYKEIGHMVSGKGKLGSLISGVIDLDNIDNVFRMAYHVGIVKSGDIALELARNMWVDERGLVVSTKVIPLLEEWQHVRYKLYKLLLLNPEEFSGKCMLSDAISIAKSKNQTKLNWYDTDYELLKKIYLEKSFKMRVREFIFEVDHLKADEFNNQMINDELVESFKENNISLSLESKISDVDGSLIVSDRQNEYLLEIEGDRYKVYNLIPKDFDLSGIVMRLMSGKLYGCLGIFSTGKIEKYSLFTSFAKKLEIENDINRALKAKVKDSKFKSVMVSIHPILDVNKTERKLSLMFDDDICRELGASSRQLFLGIFVSNTNLNMYDIQHISESLLSDIRKVIAAYLTKLLDDPDLKEVELYAEIEEVRN